MRIAVAADAEARARLLELLARMGHEVVASGNGGDLVESCRGASPDLVIAGLLLPGTTGVEAAAELGKRGGPPVIVLADRGPAELPGHVAGLLTAPVGEGQLEEAIALAVAAPA